MHLWLVLIVFVQRSRRVNETGERGGIEEAVRAGSHWICSQSSCTGGQGERIAFEGRAASATMY